MQLHSHCSDSVTGDATVASSFETAAMLAPRAEPLGFKRAPHNCYLFSLKMAGAGIIETSAAKSDLLAFHLLRSHRVKLRHLVGF